MGRPTVHDSDALLDAAVALFARGGVRAVTMAAVAREARAPSGSVYHRFPDRGSLLAALWQRTARDFEAAYRAVLGPRPTADAVVEGAVWIVDWCRANPGVAAVLDAGAQAFEPGTWPDGIRRAHAATVRVRDRELAALVDSLAADTGVAHDEIAFAMVGLPIAVVSGHLRVAEPVPAGATDLVRRLSSRVLGLG